MFLKSWERNKGTGLFSTHVPVKEMALGLTSMEEMTLDLTSMEEMALGLNLRGRGDPGLNLHAQSP